MSAVVVYFRPTCPYCQKALKLLDRKGISPELINITEYPERRDEMIEKANGRTTVPQIFINDHHVGGCDDLHELDYDGKLDSLLAGA